MVIQNAFHSLLCHLPRRTGPLFCLMALCALLTGFAAQVPSPPPETPAPPAAARPAPAQARPTPRATVPEAAPQTPAQTPAPTTPVPEAADAPRPAVAVQTRAQAAPLQDLAPAQATPVSPEVDPTRITAPLPLRDKLEWFLDPGFQMDVEEVMQKHAEDFRPLTGALPHENGRVWLRLRIAPMPEGMGEQVYFNPGPGLPGSLSVWMTRPGAGEPVTVRPDDGRYPLLYSRSGGALYMQLDGWPATGFAPWLDTDRLDVQDSDWVRFLCCALLGFAALLCLLRGLLERREWRIWAALFALSSLVSGLWGLPVLVGGRLTPWEIPAVIAPALALFIFPHAGRHLLQPRNTMPWLDNLFILLSLLGLAVGLTPLIPGQGWLLRLQPLWPLGLGVNLLLCLPACRKGLAGWGRFALACLLAVAGVIPLLTPLAPDRPELGPWISLAPLAGLSLSALLLSLVGGKPAPRATVERRGARRKPRMPQVPANLELESLAESEEDLPFATPGSEPSGPMPPRGESAPLSLETPGPQNAAARPLPGPGSSALKKKDPFARLAKPLREKQRPASGTASTAAKQPSPRPAAPRIDGPDPVLLTQLEETLRVPLDALLRETIALDMYALPEEIKAHVTAMVRAGRTLNGIITNIARTGLPHPAKVTIENAYIDLPLLLRDAHAAVAAEAENRNLAVSWYMAPHLGRRYTGPADRLSHVLRMLMESAVQATERGSVQLWARRVQESNDPGHLVFTVADTGTGMPPERRNPLLPATLWELVGETGGSLNIDSTPSGTTISFSVSLKALPAHSALAAGDSMVLSAASADDAPLALPSLRLILADDVPSRRQLLAYMLEDLPHELIEARSAAEAAVLHSEIPARLIIFDGNMPEKELADAVAAIRAHEGEHELPPSVLLALVGHEAQGERLRRAGVDQILYKPVNRAILRQAVLHLAPVPGMELPPLPSAEPPARPVEPVLPEPKPAAPVVSLPEPEEPAAAGRPEVPAPARPLAPTPAPTVNAEALPSLGRQPDVERKAPRRTQRPTPPAQPEVPPAGRPVLENLVPEPVRAPSSVSEETDAPLDLPPRRARAEKGRRAFGVLDQLLGVLPHKKKPLPSPTASGDEPVREKTVTARSASHVGEPTPLPRKAADSGDGAAKTRTKPWSRDITPVPPRLAPRGDDSHLSENGVGEPMPIPRPGSSDAQLSENGVGEPMPLVKPSLAAEAAHGTEAPQVADERGAAVPLPDDERFSENGVGEPVPVPRTRPSGQTVSAPAEAGGPEQPDSLPPNPEPGPWRGASLLDLIEEVEPLSPESAPSEPESGTSEIPAVATAPLRDPEPVEPVDAGSDEQEDAVFRSLLQTLDDGLVQVQDGLHRKDTASVIAATGAMADQAEQFGLHVLARLARGMQEMAATDDGLEAVIETMPDLKTAVERNKNAFLR